MQRTTLRSTVAEAGLLADGAAHGRLTTPYVASHAGELADDASSVESSLADSSVTPDARGPAARVRGVAARVAGAMRRLGARPGDRALAAAQSARMAAADRELRSS